MKEFVKFNKKENDDSVKNYQFIYEGETVDVMNSARRFFSFVSQDGMYRLNISKENSVFINNPPKFGREYKVSLSKKN